MGADDNLHASIAHLALCCVAGRGISGPASRISGLASRISDASYTHPGMHANFFIHGIVGFLHYQSGIFNNDFNAMYLISLKAVRYLALPCLNADLRRSDQNLSLLHLLSGVVPFALALSNNDNVPLGNLAIGLNIISLCHYSHLRNREYGWYTAGAACLAYFVAPQSDQKFLFPLALALMEYFAYRVYHIHYEL